MSSCGISVQFWVAHPERLSETKEGHHWTQKNLKTADNSGHNYPKKAKEAHGFSLHSMSRSPITVSQKLATVLRMRCGSSSHIWLQPFPHAAPANFPLTELILRLPLCVKCSSVSLTHCSLGHV